MAVYERSTVIDAPLADVWAFHSSPEGLLAITPSWLGVRIGGITAPADDSEDPTLTVGTEMTLTVKGGPTWTAKITDRTESDGSAMFRDVMIDGPFEKWEHTHRFTAIDDRTVMEDRVEYRLPLGPFSRFSNVARPLFEAVFAYRHHRTKALLAT